MHTGWRTIFLRIMILHRWLGKTTFFAIFRMIISCFASNQKIATSISTGFVQLLLQQIPSFKLAVMTRIFLSLEKRFIGLSFQIFK